MSLSQAQDDARQQLREFEETKKQIEEDEDREIQDIKTKYEKKLRDEKEANLRLKGETGIMRKKVRALSWLPGAGKLWGSSGPGPRACPRGWPSEGDRWLAPALLSSPCPLVPLSLPRFSQNPHYGDGPEQGCPSSPLANQGCAV